MKTVEERIARARGLCERTGTAFEWVPSNFSVSIGVLGEVISCENALDSWSREELNACYFALGYELGKAEATDVPDPVWED